MENLTIKKYALAGLAIDKFGSMSEFANALGISKQGLYLRINCGKCRYEKAYQMAKALDVALQEIVEEDIG